MIKHPNAKSVSCEVETSTGGNVEFVLVVMTDLELDRSSPSFTKVKIDNLVTAVQEYLRVSKVANRARIRTLR
jgi:hypothetical protein